jgi:hypothetical protein
LRIAGILSRPPVIRGLSSVSHTQLIHLGSDDLELDQVCFQPYLQRAQLQYMLFLVVIELRLLYTMFRARGFNIGTVETAPFR